MKWEEWQHRLPDWAVKYGKSTGNAPDGWHPEQVYECKPVNCSYEVSVESLSDPRPVGRWLMLGCSIGIAFVFTILDAWKWDGFPVFFAYFVMLILGAGSIIAIGSTMGVSEDDKRKTIISLIAKYKARIQDFDNERVYAIEKRRDWLWELNQAEKAERESRSVKFWHEYKIGQMAMNSRSQEIYFYNELLKEIAYIEVASKRAYIQNSENDSNLMDVGFTLAPHGFSD